MQASSAPPAASTTELATSLLGLWKHVAREAGAQFADLLEDLDLSLAQVKTLETLLGHTGAPSVKELSASLGCSLANSSRGVDATCGVPSSTARSPAITRAMPSPSGSAQRLNSSMATRLGPIRTVNWGRSTVAGMETGPIATA